VVDSRCFGASKRRKDRCLGRADVVNNRFVIARLFILASTVFTVVQTISSLSRRALVGRLFFRHYLVVEPSATLGLSTYICGLAADCPILEIITLWYSRL
jgi:hypothetical protein